MTRGAALRTGLASLLISSGAAEASDRLDHRGSVGLLVAGGIGTGDRISGLKFDDYPGRLFGALGISGAVGRNGNEIKLVASAGRRSGTNPSWSLSGGYRGYFGEDRLKTFFDLDATLDLHPAVAIGPRIGIGAQWEITSLVGIFAALAVHAGVGQGSIFAGDALIGFQVRSYLLE